jgi:hypothetical protein
VNTSLELSRKPTSLRSIVDWWWTGAVVLLAFPGGWALASKLLDDPGIGVLLAHSAGASASVLIGLFINGVLSQRHARNAYSSPIALALNPTGWRNLSYFLPDNPQLEFRSALASTLILLVSGSTLTIPLLLSRDDPTMTHIAIPSLVLAVILLVQVLPAFPFHGGYILRSIFWFLYDDAQTGTRAPFLYSQIVASGALGFGIYFFYLGASFFLLGVWCFSFTILVLVSAREELRRVNFIVRAEKVRAADAVAGLNPTVRAAAPLTEAVDILLEQKQNGPGLVRDRNVYSGALMLDTIRGIPRSEWKRLTASDATVSFESLDGTPPGADLLLTLRQLQRSRSGAVIIYEQNGEIVGLIDASMNPRALLRRGINRDPTQLLGHQSGQKGPKTS